MIDRTVLVSSDFVVEFAFRANSDSPPHRPRDTRPRSPQLATRQRAQQRQTHVKHTFQSLNRKRPASRLLSKAPAAAAHRLRRTASTVGPPSKQLRVTKPKPFTFEAREAARAAYASARADRAAQEAADQGALNETVSRAASTRPVRCQGSSTAPAAASHSIPEFSSAHRRDRRPRRSTAST